MKRAAVMASAVLACLALPGLAQQTTVFATGLKNPAKVILAGGGSLLVSEVDAALNSGRVSLVDPGGRVRPLLEGLPSGPAAPDGTLDGPAGMALADRTLFVVNGEGNTHVPGPRPGTIVPNPAGSSSPIYSSILKVVFSNDPARILEPFVLPRAGHDTLADGHTLTLRNAAGDTAALELLADFRDNVPDEQMIYRNSHPYAITLHPAFPDSLFVADAGTNAVLRVDIATGRTRTLARLSSIPTGIPARPFAEAVAIPLLEAWSGTDAADLAPAAPRGRQTAHVEWAPALAPVVCDAVATLAIAA